jgi:hypothetical protein
VSPVLVTVASVAIVLAMRPLVARWLPSRCIGPRPGLANLAGAHPGETTLIPLPPARLDGLARGGPGRSIWCWRCGEVASNLPFHRLQRRPQIHNRILHASDRGRTRNANRCRTRRSRRGWCGTPHRRGAEGGRGQSAAHATANPGHGLWGSRTCPRRMTSGFRCVLVLADQSAKDRSPADRAADRLWMGRLRAWRTQPQRSVRPLLVVSTAYRARTLRRRCSPKISIRSVSSVRTVNTKRSAKQFARDTAAGS